MERKHDFVEGENFHLFTRGVDKRVVFENKEDYQRFLVLLLLCNGKERIDVPNILKKYRGEPSAMVFEHEASAETIVDILAYALMPNHLHLIVREKEAGGISRFMLKLMTAYSMYFNKKNERSGPLFTRPFRSKHVDSDEYFRWVFSYVHLNPLELLQRDWKERGLEDLRRAGTFLYDYPYSSFPDYSDRKRPESRILSKKALPVEEQEIRAMDGLLKIFFSTSPDIQTMSPYSARVEKALV